MKHFDICSKTHLKISEGPSPLGMDNSLWDPLPVEVCELLYEDMILEQQRPPRSHAEAVELVPHWGPVSRGEAVWILNEKISQQFQDSFSSVGFFKETS